MQFNLAVAAPELMEKLQIFISLALFFDLADFLLLHAIDDF